MTGRRRPSRGPGKAPGTGCLAGGLRHFAGVECIFWSGQPSVLLCLMPALAGAGLYLLGADAGRRAAAHGAERRRCRGQSDLHPAAGPFVVAVILFYRWMSLPGGPRRSPAGPRSSRLGGASQGVFSRNKKELPLRCFLRSAAQPIAISDQAADVWPTAVEPTAAQGTARHQRMICSYGTIVSSAGDCAGRLNRRQDHLRRLT